MEVRIAEVRIAEVRLAQVRTDVGVLTTPRVPGIHALLEYRDVLVSWKHRQRHHIILGRVDDAINQVGQTFGLTLRLRQPAIADVAERMERGCSAGAFGQYEDRWSTHGYAATREAAMAAFVNVMAVREPPAAS
jgi:hypothetical protein